MHGCYLMGHNLTSSQEVTPVWMSNICSGNISGSLPHCSVKPAERTLMMGTCRASVGRAGQYQQTYDGQT